MFSYGFEIINTLLFSCCYWDDGEDKMLQQGLEETLIPFLVISLCNCHRIGNTSWREGCRYKRILINGNRRISIVHTWWWDQNPNKRQVVARYACSFLVKTAGRINNEGSIRSKYFFLKWDQNHSMMVATSTHTYCQSSYASSRRGKYESQNHLDVNSFT